MATVTTAATAVETATAAGSAAPLDLSIIGMFMHAGLTGKLVILLLLVASFWSWAIIFDKWLKLKSIVARAKRFEQDFWNSEALDAFHERVKKRPSHPLSVVFMAAMEEWFRVKIKDMAALNPIARGALKERVHQAMMVARNRELDELEEGLGFLATVGSTAPFVGLFGTVWGIMDSFQSIALTKNTTLAVVAPGIAEALFATAIGLFAAIPAVIAYNRFSNELNRIGGRIDDFSQEFLLLLSRQLDGNS